MQLFQHSLIGSALQWFTRLDLRKITTWGELVATFKNQYKHNIDLSTDRWTLTMMAKEENVSFRTYA